MPQDETHKIKGLPRNVDITNCASTKLAKTQCANTHVANTTFSNSKSAKTTI